MTIRVVTLNLLDGAPFPAGGMPVSRPVARTPTHRLSRREPRGRVLDEDAAGVALRPVIFLM